MDLGQAKAKGLRCTGVENGVSRPVGFDWPVGVAVAHQQASFDAAGAPDAPM